MKTDNVLLIVCGVLLFVGVLNLGLLVGVLSGRNREQFKIFGKAIEAVRNPWRKSEEEYTELRKRVADLGEEKGED